MRKDGKKQVCIVGLQEFEVSDVQIVKEYIERGNAARSTGSTGANEESSRSHAILTSSIFFVLLALECLLGLFVI